LYYSSCNSTSNEHGLIPYEKKIKYFFGSFFDLFGAAQTSPFFLGQFKFFSEGLMEKNYIPKS
jgi:hypothetical protein